jgi:hypothetical protein
LSKEETKFNRWINGIKTVTLEECGFTQESFDELMKAIENGDDGDGEYWVKRKINQTNNKQEV